MEEYQNQMLFGNNNEAGVKVMTDDQLEMLRKQISIYSSLCESLVQTHTAFSGQHHLSGMRMPSSYNGPFWPYTVNRIPSRQRWAPKQEQLGKLESMFNESSVTPDREKVKEIAAQLLVHGPISEANVCNWFQNRRARSKRKKSRLAPPEIRESEEKKTEEVDEIQPDENLEFMVNQMYSQSPEIQGIDYLMGKEEIPVSYNPYRQLEHDLLG
ncbi:WUSCHEL-related homeobox 8-like [Mercurialis annua]|uniref:WUSCHEL-related homeobox 8-like n=1 Tax=Mercurialis annua TaxID=3986 RepID=UPI00215F5A47|nr:WUSCHEL-related homeobox 8-like [Mercurialis annua]